jgi:hypothetical protein
MMYAFSGFYALNKTFLRLSQSAPAEPLECGCLGYCWQTPSAPEARGKLAGGGAKRNHR